MNTRTRVNVSQVQVISVWLTHGSSSKSKDEEVDHCKVDHINISVKWLIRLLRGDFNACMLVLGAVG